MRGVWLRRYLPAELTCIPVAVGCAWFVESLTDSKAAAALAGNAGENLAFYAVMLAREWLPCGRARTLPGILYALVLEFGPAEVADCLLLRPWLMYAGMVLAPSPALGIIAGKIAADICFYAQTIASNELRRRTAHRGQGC